jgi:hypothetical protein
LVSMLVITQLVTNTRNRSVRTGEGRN